MTNLYWNNQGQIGCEQKSHVPFVGSDTFVNEQWEKISPNVVKKHSLKCEVCKDA